MVVVVVDVLVVVVVEEDVVEVKGVEEVESVEDETIEAEKGGEAAVTEVVAEVVAEVLSEEADIGKPPASSLHRPSNLTLPSEQVHSTPFGWTFCSP